MIIIVFSIHTHFQNKHFQSKKVAHPKPSTSPKWAQTYPIYLASSLDITVAVQYKGEVKVDI